MLKKLYLIHHSHTDIGYTHSQPVVLHLQRAYMDQALELVEATEAYPEGAKGKWTCETGLPVLEWLAKLAEETGRVIPVRLVKGAYWDTEIKRAGTHQVSGEALAHAAGVDCCSPGHRDRCAGSHNSRDVPGGAGRLGERGNAFRVRHGCRISQVHKCRKQRGVKVSVAQGVGFFELVDEANREDIDLGGQAFGPVEALHITRGIKAGPQAFELVGKCPQFVENRCAGSHHGYGSPATHDFSAV
jgi:hypothetical protein